MHLVDDKNLKASDRRSVLGLLDEPLYIVDTAVTGRVHLDDIDVAAFVCGDTVGALLAWLASRAVIANQRLRKYPRARGLAATAKPRKKVGVGEAALVQSVRETGADGLLAYELAKISRSISKR